MHCGAPPLIFRNTKSSQEVVDFVWSRLTERRDSEQALGSVLESICESVSHVHCTYCKVPSKPPFLASRIDKIVGGGGYTILRSSAPFLRMRTV